MNPADFKNLLESVEQHLLDLKGQGITELDVKPETLRALASGAPAMRSGTDPAPRRAPASETARPATPPPPPVAPRPSTARKPESEVVAGLKEIAKRIASCEKCRLCKTRTNVVPGQGHPAPEIMFVGEGPGADEDEQGLAFVGKAGQLLTKIIAAMGFTREEVFIGNIVKCRPPDNRVPLPDEMQSCLPYLHEQIALLQPRVIVCLGATAVKGLFGEGIGGITKIRGKWLQYQGIDAMPTYHPAYLLRNPPAKPDVWTDMKEVLARLGRVPPPRS